MVHRACFSYGPCLHDGHRHHSYPCRFHSQRASPLGEPADQALMRHDFATSLAWAIVTGIMVASSYGLNSVGFSMQRLAQIPMATWCNEAVNSYLYHREPKELENSDTGDQARQARDAIDSGSLTLQAFSLLSLVSSAIVCISLTVTIWGRAGCRRFWFCFPCSPA